MRVAKHFVHPRQRWMAMSNDDPTPTALAPQDGKRIRQPPKSSWFDVPPALKRIFDKFPLVTYDENELPLRASSRRREEHVLYVFATEEDARAGRPSFNPQCLRWQTYLKLSGVCHRTVASNNHASPSGVLPFFLPAAHDEPASPPIPSNRLKRWVSTQHKAEKKDPADETEDVRFEAYQALLESRVRVAWLYQLYLNPTNGPLLHKLYIAPCSSNPLVQTTISYQLREAAQTAIVKTTASPTIVESDIVRAVDEALRALSALLGENEYFFGQEKPGLFDASVFAYTQLLLDDQMAWEENQLGDALKEHANLVQHCYRVRQTHF